ncbi:MAG TPA: S41 family peptidase [Spirochaetales bacterium]|nr:S41 family peptidase [Spirochaetales bacterium]
MMSKPGAAGRHRIAWGAVAAAMVLVSTISVSVPRAFAQPALRDDQETRRYLQILNDAFRIVLQSYVDKPEPKKLYEGAMKGLFDSLGDPYSVFLDEAMMSDMNDFATGEFGGVGLVISKQLRDPKKAEDQPLYVEVVSPIENTPGWARGIQPGDLIIKIDGESTAPMLIDEAQKRIRGPVGSSVVLTFRRGQGQVFDAPFVRARVELPVVKKALIPTAKGNVGYLRIIEFTKLTAPKVEEALAEFGKAGYRALVLDVRNNPGGLLDSAIQVADAFLDSGLIVSTKSRLPYENSVSKAKPGQSLPPELPIILLMNKGSASASEILAGALKDNRRAYLVGENSYGKGSVQQPFPVDETGFKLTIARYYTPSDENIDKTGIPPDLESKEPELGEAEIAELGKLLDSGRIESFATANPGASVAQRNAFAALLAKDFKLSERVLRRLVHNELARKTVAPAYDLEFDAALNAALALFDKPDFASLLQGTKTVKELVEAKRAAGAAQAAAGAPGLPEPAVGSPSR